MDLWNLTFLLLGFCIGNGGLLLHEVWKDWMDRRVTQQMAQGIRLRVFKTLISTPAFSEGDGIKLRDEFYMVRKVGIGEIWCERVS